MTLNIEDITTLFGSLINNSKNILDTEYDKGSIDSSEYAKVLETLLSNAMALSVQTVQSQQRIDSDLLTAEKQRESIDKDVQLKDYELQNIEPLKKAQLENQNNQILKQIDKLNKDIDIEERQMVVQEEQSEKDLLIKDSQKLQIDKDIDVKTQQITSMQISDTIKQDQSDKDLLTKQAQIDSINKKTSIDDYNLTELLPIKKDRSLIAKDVEDGSKQAKIDLATYQAEKMHNDADYSAEKTTQLVQSVEDNRKIKALDSLADTYGTFGAGGLTLSSDMWNTYFSIIATLTGATEPDSTTVTRV